MQYRAKKLVNLGGGQFLTEGQTVELPADVHLPGLEPVLERDAGGPTIERMTSEKNLDAPIKGNKILEHV